MNTSTVTARYLAAAGVHHVFGYPGDPNIVENTLGTVRQVSRNVQALAQWRDGAPVDRRGYTGGPGDLRKTQRPTGKPPIHRNALHEHMRKAQAESTIETVMKAA